MGENDFRYLLNKDLGKKCLILGGSPNIKNIDFENFDGIIISMGNIPVRIKEKRHVDYWMVANSLFPLPDKHYKILNEFIDTTLVFASSVSNSIVSTDYNKIKQKLKIPWVEYDQRHFNGLDCNKQNDYRFDLDNPLNCCQHKKTITIQEYLQEIYKRDSHYSTGSTVAIHSVSMAIILGCKEIYIAGVDLPIYKKDYVHFGTETSFQIIKAFIIEIFRGVRTIPLSAVLSSIFKTNKKSIFYKDLPVILNDFEYLNNLCINNDIKLFNLSPLSTLNKIHNFKFFDPVAFNKLFTNN